MRPLPAVGLSAALVAGCGRGRTGEVAAPPVQPPAAPVEPAGVVLDGLFQDADHRLTLTLPPPWTGEPGRRGEALRLTARHPLAEVEVWVHADPDLQPRPRADCAWTFVDRAPGGEVVGSCTSGRPQDPLRMAWVWPLGDGALEVGARLGPAELAAADRAVRSLISGLRAGDGGPGGPAAAP